MTHDI